MGSVYTRPHSRFYWLKLRGYDDEIWRFSSGIPKPHRNLAVMLLQRHEQLHACVRLGVITSDQLLASKRGLTPIADVVEEYLGEGGKATRIYAEKFRSEAARKDARGILNRFIETTGAETVGELSNPAIVARVLEWLAQVAGTGVQLDRVRDCLAALKRFSAWAKQRKYLAADEVANVDRGWTSGTDERKVEHRALTPQELQRLDATPRGVYYRFRCLTGLRGTTVHLLERGDFDFGADIPHMRIRKETTKNGLQALLPIPPTLIEPLRELIGMRTGLIFGDLPEDKQLLKTIRRDMKSAHIDARLINGRSFRMTHMTYCRAAGVDDQTAGTLRVDRGEGTAALRRWSYSDPVQLLPMLRDAVAAVERYAATECQKRAEVSA